MGRQFKRIRPGLKEPWLTIVGVVPDLLMEGIGNNNASPVGYYIPISQSDVANGVRIAVRTPAIPPRRRRRARGRGVARRRSRDLRVTTMRLVIDRQTWFYTVFGTFFMAFGCCALFLAVGRALRRDVVCRDAADARNGRALGAWRERPQLILLMMRKSVVQLAIGLALGLGLALLASGALQPILYHVNPRDARGVCGGGRDAGVRQPRSRASCRRGG